MKYVLVVDHFPESILDALKKYLAAHSQETLGILILTRNPEHYKVVKDDGIIIKVVMCSYGSDEEVKKVIEPYKNSIAGVICRGDKQTQYLRKLVPHLERSVRVSSIKSLKTATNKRMMREAFTEFYPEITPKFMKINNDSARTITAIRQQVPFPVIIKPASLASSLLIQSCKSEHELKPALRNIFALLSDIYTREERNDEPEVIVEEYLEGDFYSIDAYVMEEGDIYFCPPVGYIPAQKLGINDFFLYKRFLPTTLSAKDIKVANKVVKKAVMSVGLRYSSAHVELIKTENGWKVIELGPRLGRFRQTMYQKGYGINHSYNDLAIHLGAKPEIPDTLEQYCATYSIYPHQEGILKELIGLEKLTRNPFIFAFKRFDKPGEHVRFAKNGGRALAEFVVASPDKAEFDALSTYIEENVKAVISLEKS